MLFATLAGVAATGAWLATRPGPLQLVNQGRNVIGKDPVEAERLFRRAVSRSGGRHADARLALCGVLARKGAWDEALPLFVGSDQAAARADLLLEFGRAAYQAGQRGPALAALQEVRRRGTPESASALEILMADYHERQQQGELLKGARELTRLEPDNPARWAGLIGLLRAMSMDAECLATIRTAMQQRIPDDFRHELRHQLVDRLIVMGDAAAASGELAQLKRQEGMSQRVRRHEIELFRLEGKLEAALKSIAAGFPNLEKQPDLFALRGAVYLDLAKFDEAAADLERAVVHKTSDEESQFKLAEAYRSLGRRELAAHHRELAKAIYRRRILINKLLKKLPIEPDNPQLYRQLAELHRELDEPESAEKWERRAARLAARGLAQ
jgi:tetratricopeptide (TPR) repeat protein